MKETLTVRDSVREALRRGENQLHQVRWLLSQGEWEHEQGECEHEQWLLWKAHQRAVWRTDDARAIADNINAQAAFARHRAKVLSGFYERERAAKAA